MMLSYVGKRLLQLIPVLLGMTFIVFMIIRAIPGNPAQDYSWPTSDKRSGRGIDGEAWSR